MKAYEVYQVALGAQLNLIRLTDQLLFTDQINLLLALQFTTLMAQFSQTS